VLNSHIKNGERASACSCARSQRAATPECGGMTSHQAASGTGQRHLGDDGVDQPQTGDDSVSVRRIPQPPTLQPPPFPHVRACITTYPLASRSSPPTSCSPLVTSASQWRHRRTSFPLGSKSMCVSTSFSHVAHCPTGKAESSNDGVAIARRMLVYLVLKIQMAARLPKGPTGNLRGGWPVVPS
jgi:hypothetical protein